MSLGAWPDGVFRYRALDAAAWLKRNRPNPKILDQLALEKARPIIVMRTEESFAAYLEGKASDAAPVIGPVIEAILDLKLDAQIVVSTRYGRQAPVLKQRFGAKVKILDHVIDTTSLLHYSTIFIGSGGTMTVEAALLGKPAISCFPGPKTLYMKYLEDHGLMKTIRSPTRIARATAEAIVSRSVEDRQGRKGRELLRRMEDPIRVVSLAVKKTWKGV